MSPLDKKISEAYYILNIIFTLAEKTTTH